MNEATVSKEILTTGTKVHKIILTSDQSSWYMAEYSVPIFG